MLLSNPEIVLTSLHTKATVFYFGSLLCLQDMVRIWFRMRSWKKAKQSKAKQSKAKQSKKASLGIVFFLLGKVISGIEGKQNTTLIENHF
jgi:cytochrome b561